MVIEHHPIKTPRDAPADEFLDCVWQELTDKVHYLPGGLVKGKVSYKACFHDLPNGLQTHIYAPTGLDIREKWSIGGSLPGEPPEKQELNSNAPSSGLYLKEEGDMRCNRFLNSFVRKNLDEAHKVLVERIMRKAELIEQHRSQSNLSQPRKAVRGSTFSPTNFYNTAGNPSDAIQYTPTSTLNGEPRATPFQPGSHMSQSKILQSPMLQSPTSLSPQQPPTGKPHDSSGTRAPNLADHPAFRGQDSTSTHSANPSWSTNQSSSNTTTTRSHNHSFSYSDTPIQAKHPPRQAKQRYLAELQGSDVQSPPARSLSPPQGSENDPRFSVLSDVSSDVPQGGTDRGSVVSDIPGMAYQGTVVPPPGGYRYNPQDYVR
jgi:hypothetical protein